MKTIYVVGGFGRNYGDLVLQESLFGRLRKFPWEKFLISKSCLGIVSAFE